MLSEIFSLIVTRSKYGCQYESYCSTRKDQCEHVPCESLSDCWLERLFPGHIHHVFAILITDYIVEQSLIKYLQSLFSCKRREFRIDIIVHQMIENQVDSISYNKR